MSRKTVYNHDYEAILN